MTPGRAQQRYGAENGTWRCAYLSGAYELRHGDPERLQAAGVRIEGDAAVLSRRQPGSARCPASSLFRLGGQARPADLAG